MDAVINFGLVVVNQGYDASAFVIVLRSGDGARLPNPASGQYDLTWWCSSHYADPALDPGREIVRAITLTGDTLTLANNGSARTGQQGTTPSTKNTAGRTYSMVLSWTKKNVDQIVTELAGKSDVGHNHDDRYYTDAEVDSFLSGKQDVLGYTPEDLANKDDDETMAENSSDKYPTQRAVKTYVDEGLATKQDLLGFTPENVANKATDFSVVNNTKYPTTQAVQNAINSAVVGLLDDRGNYDASGNVFPSSGGSGSAGAILKGDIWIISVAGTLGGVAVTAGDQVRALVDTPGQTAGNWAISEANIGYVPENTANKSTNTSLGTSNTLFPTQNAVKVYADNLISGLSAVYQPLDSDLSAIAALSPANDTLIMRAGGAWTAQTPAYLKNKMNYRVVAYTDAATVTLNVDTTDIGTLLTLSQTTNFANPTGTPVDGQYIAVRAKSSTSRLLTWGNKFRGITGRPLPGATTGNNHIDFYEFIYNGTDDKYDLINRSPNVAKYYSTGQSGLTAGAETIINWDSTAFDTDPSWFNSSTDRWTPQVKGRYAVVFQVVWASDHAGPAGDFTEARIFKNAAAIANNGAEIGWSVYGDSLQVATVVEMNGTTDYLEWRILSPAGSVNPILFGGQSLTYTTIIFLGGM